MATTLFYICLISGLVLVGAEIFVPGGVIGIMGGLALIVAVVCGYIAYPDYGTAIAVGVLLLVGAAFVLWIRIFPHTRMGRKMTVSTNLATSKTADSLEALLGKEGTAVSPLRPSGFALIDGQRTDVVSDGELISPGDSVRVVGVEGNRVTVARIASPERTSA